LIYLFIYLFIENAMIVDKCYDHDYCMCIISYVEWGWQLVPTLISVFAISMMWN